MARCSWASNTHALSEPAFARRSAVLAANGVQVMIARDREYTPTPAISHAILKYNRGRTTGLADGIVITPSHNPPGRRRLQIQSSARRSRETATHHIVHSGASQPVSETGSLGRAPDPVRARARGVASARLHRRICRAICKACWISTPSARSISRSGSIRRRGRPLLGSYCRKVPPQC